MDTMTVPLKERTVQWAVEALTEKGYRRLSYRRVRLYADLLSPAVRTLRCGEQVERRFAPEDFARLEHAVILKGVGFSNREVRQWFRRNGKAAALRQRLGEQLAAMEHLVERAANLVREPSR